MPGVCAVCRVPLAKGEKFVMQASEVVHARCVGGQTMATRLKLDNIEARRQLEEIRGDVRRAQNELMASRLEAKDLRAELKAALATRGDYKDQRDAARRERDQAIAERDAARREAALHQTIQQSIPVTPAAGPASAPAPDKPRDDRDPTEVRFSLLDLD